MDREGFMKQIAEAKVSVAKSALANPFVYHEASELHEARRELKRAQARVERAQAVWDKFIAPAKGWAPDPLKEV